MAERPKTRRIRIEHDGELSAMKLRIMDAETEEQLSYVRRVEVTADAAIGTVDAVVYMIAPELAVTVDAEVRTEDRLTKSAIHDIVELVVQRFEPALNRLRFAIEDSKKGAEIGPFFDVEQPNE